MDWGGKITYLAETTQKERKVTFGIKDLDRLEHMCVIGRAGNDRTDFLARMILEDVKRGMGAVLLDATGKLSRLVLERITEDTKSRLIYLDPADGEYPYSWNPLDDFRSLAPDIAKPLLSRALASIYKISPSPLTEIASAVMLEKTDSTLLRFYDLATEEEVRKSVFAGSPDIAMHFDEALKENAEAVEEIKQHGRYVAKDSLVRNLLGQTESKFTLGKLAENAIIVVDYSRIKMFPTRMTSLVRTFVHAIEAHSHGRAEPSSLFLNDCLRYLSETDVDLLFSKHAVLTCISDTFYGDEEKGLREMTVSRSGSVIAFTPNAGDVATVERVFYPYVTADELGKLEEGEFIIALTIDAVRSRPFFAHVLPLQPRNGLSVQDLMSASRDRYTMSRAKVDLLYRKLKPPGDGRGKPKPGEPGAFSDAFRSIFSKRTPPSGLIPSQQKAGAMTPPREPAKLEPKQPPGEIPESDLRSMLKVDSEKGFSKE